MAGPPIPPIDPIPAINKTYSDIRFFVKNPETTKAFEEIPFTGTIDGYLGLNNVTKIPYPNEDFDNTNDGVYPFIDLENLSDNYELKTPVLKGVGSATGTVVTGTNIFTNVQVDTYLLYRDSEGTYGGDYDGLKVLGYVIQRVSNSQLNLSANVPLEVEGMDIEIFTWNGANNAEFLNNFNFHFQDSFYMVVKNPNYTASSSGGNHDAILLIDTERTSADYTNFPQPFAYSNSRILNPKYFSLQRISKVFNPTKPETDQNGDPIVVNIPCSIKGVSKWSEKSMFANTNITDGDDRIPFWSVYEIDPNPGSNIHLDRKSFYRLTINTTTPGGLPSSKVFNNFTPIE
jgi:hypothetical protein